MAFVVFALVLLLLAGCYDEPLEMDAGGGPAPAIEAVQARYGRIALERRLPGMVKAKNQVAIRSELSARVAEVFARSGDAVTRGEPLVRLEDASFSDQLRQAEANTRLAEASEREAGARIVELEAQVRRSRVLVQENLISDLELETQEARLEAARAGAEQAAAAVAQARAAVAERRTVIAKTVVRAPVAGRVGERDVEVGSLVDPGTTLFVIGDLDELRVEVSLNEALLGQVTQGQPVLVSAPALGEDAVPARISRISPFLAEGSFSTAAEIDIGNPEGRLRPGMFVNVDVAYGESAPAAQVPASALWEDPRSGVEGIFVAERATPGDADEEGARRDGGDGDEDNAGRGQPADRSAARAAEVEADELAADTDGEPAGVEMTVSFRPVDVLTEGRGAAAVLGVEAGEWVVTVGQHLLRAGKPNVARVHATTWDEVLELEGLQREDVLRAFLAKQRDAARTLGARPPTKDEMLDRPSSP